MGKLRAAFGMISAALDIPRPTVPDGGVDLGELHPPAHRPARMSRRGGANGVNSAHYKNNNRGGGVNPGGQYRTHRGAAPGFN